MPLVAAYHRPETMAAALQLLSGPDRVVLAGGTELNSDRAASNLEAVDLQGLGLDGIRSRPGSSGAGDAPAGTRIQLGAMASLDDVARSDLVPDGLRERARAEEPSTLRTLATVGGLVACASGDSPLLAALLAHGATVELAGAGAGARGLAELLTAPLPSGSIITGIDIDPSGDWGYAATGRTPADMPIVSAYGRCAADSGRRAVTMALSGLASLPVMVTTTEPSTTTGISGPGEPAPALTAQLTSLLTSRMAGLDPRADFRGSAEYRLAIALILMARVAEELS